MPSRTQLGELPSTVITHASRLATWLSSCATIASSSEVSHASSSPVVTCSVAPARQCGRPDQRRVVAQDDQSWDRHVGHRGKPVEQPALARVVGGLRRPALVRPDQEPVEREPHDDHRSPPRDGDDQPRQDRDRGDGAQRRRRQRDDHADLEPRDRVGRAPCAARAQSTGSARGRKWGLRPHW
jgi:hypothetical protein